MKTTIAVILFCLFASTAFAVDRYTVFDGGMDQTLINGTNVVERVWMHASYSATSSDPLKRALLYKTTDGIPDGPELYDEVVAKCQGFIAGILNQLYYQRNNTVGRLFTSNAAVAFTENEIFLAALAVQNGVGESVQTKVGDSAEGMMADYGEATETTPLEFATLSVQAGLQFIPSMHFANVEYHRLRDVAVPKMYLRSATPITDLLKVVPEYKSYTDAL